MANEVMMHCQGCGKNVAVISRGGTMVWTVHASGHPNSVRCWSSGTALTTALAAEAWRKMHSSDRPKS